MPCLWVALGQRLSARSGVMRLLVSATYVASGGPLGLEAPTFYVSAAVSFAVLQVVTGSARALTGTFHLVQ